MNTKSPKATLLVAVLLVATGVVVGRLALTRKPVSRVTAAGETATDGDELAALRRQVQALQDDQSRTRLQVDHVARLGQEASDKEAAAKQAHEPKSDEELRKQDYDRSKHVVEYVQRIMDDETTDLTWAPARVQELRESFNDFKLPGFSFHDAECRSTLCRVTVARGPEAITQELGTAIMQLPPFKRMGAFFHYENDRVVMYSPREGHDFPKDPALASR